MRAIVGCGVSRSVTASCIVRGHAIVGCGDVALFDGKLRRDEDHDPKGVPAPPGALGACIVTRTTTPEESWAPPRANGIETRTTTPEESWAPPRADCLGHTAHLDRLGPPAHRHHCKQWEMPAVDTRGYGDAVTSWGPRPSRENPPPRAPSCGVTRPMTQRSQKGSPRGRTPSDALSVPVPIVSR